MLFMEKTLMLQYQKWLIAQNSIATRAALHAMGMVKLGLKVVFFLWKEHVEDVGARAKK
jgi:hypothetical protein